MAASPGLYEQVLISSQSRAQGVVIKGVDARRELRVGNLLTKLREGSLDELEKKFPDADPLIIGKELAKALGVFAGDTVLVTSPQGYLTPLEVVPKFRHFRIVGVFESGFYDYDASWAFTNLSAAQRLFDLANVVSVIQLKIENIYQAEEVAATIRQAAGPGFETSTWMEQNRALFSALRLERLVTVLTIGLIEIVAALNIFITLTMMVMEKHRDIAVLMSIGAQQRQGTGRLYASRVADRCAGHGAGSRTWVRSCRSGGPLPTDSARRPGLWALFRAVSHASARRGVDRARGHDHQLYRDGLPRARRGAAESGGNLAV